MSVEVAFLFDNDGVLVDTSSLHWKSWQLLMEEEKRLSMTHQQFIEGFGKRNDRILQEAVPESTEKERTHWADRKEELFRQCARHQVTLIEGMEPFLKQVVEANIPRIIASSTPVANLEMFLSSTVLGEYFDQYLSAEEVAEGKPAPDIFIAAAQRLSFEPSQCIVFEDSHAGLKAGRDAGCFVVALETTHTKEELDNYDLIYPSPADLELQEILRRFTVWKG